MRRGDGSDGGEAAGARGVGGGAELPRGGGSGEGSSGGGVQERF